MKIDLESQYNNRARVPDHPAIIAGWSRDAAQYRQEAGDRCSVVSYGPSPRQTLDIFAPQTPAAGSAHILFIHGGYWQGLDPSFFSHLASGPNAHGLTVALAGYDLCPDVSFGDIIEQIIAAAQLLFQRSGQPIIACGHSAGGHMAACLAATDWPSLDASYPEHPVAAGLAISGLFELEPLVPTSVNARLGLDIAAARSYSPRLWNPPEGIIFDAWVGGAESEEYLRQSAGIAAVWQAAGNETRVLHVADANHFTVLEGLAMPESALTLRLAEMALGAHSLRWPLAPARNLV
jgi:arylformamidase